MTCPTCSLSLNIHRSDTDTVDPLYEGRHVAKLQMKEQINQYIYILHFKVLRDSLVCDFAAIPKRINVHELRISLHVKRVLTLPKKYVGQIINSGFIGAANKTLSVFKKTRLNKYGQSIQRFQYFLQNKSEKSHKFDKKHRVHWKCMKIKIKP